MVRDRCGEGSGTTGPNQGMVVIMYDGRAMDIDQGVDEPPFVLPCQTERKAGHGEQGQGREGVIMH